MSVPSVRDDQAVIDATRMWIETVVVQHNFCPFAARELARDGILYSVSRATRAGDGLEALIGLCLELDADTRRDTALLILPQGFAVFEDYLDLLDLAERLLVMQGYEGIYQLASFHPDYCFADANPDDAANYTNRSPYPMLHLLREAGVERALSGYPAPESIPLRNIDTARRIGLDGMRALLEACRRDRNAE